MTDLRTFQLPESVAGTRYHVALGREMIITWQADRIFQVATEPFQDNRIRDAFASSRRFFALPLEEKSRLVSELSYSGYIPSGEEATAGEADDSEIFTICKDLPLDDVRVMAGWPCHGPVPWPDHLYRLHMAAFMHELGEIGEKLLQLTALGLGLSELDALTRLTSDGFHHMRVLRLPARSVRASRGTGTHTNHGMLAIAARDDGHPVPGMLTVFPGDILRFLTGGLLPSTPHKVTPTIRERYATAYFHEPNFEAVLRPLFDPGSGECIHYGTHFTTMSMRRYPDRITTRRILEENRLSVLPGHLDPLRC